MSDVQGNDQLTFLNDVVDLDVFDKATIGYQITGTWVGTITWTGSIDGVTFFALLPVNSAAATTTANATLWFNVNGLTRIKMAMTAYTSGTAVVNYVANIEPLAGGAPTAGSSIIPGTTALALGKAEDAVHVTGDTGVMMLAVRQDTTTTAQQAAGDYAYLTTDGGGATRVRAGNSAIITDANTVHRVQSAATTNATTVKASAGNIYKIVVANTSAAVKYVKFYNKATAPTVGTDIPVLVIAVPTVNTLVIDFSLALMPFSTGISYAMTGLGTDVDATAVAAADLTMTFLYA